MIINTVKCNMCGFTGAEEDLAYDYDADQSGEVTDQCPNCQTDNYLMDKER